MCVVCMCVCVRMSPRGHVRVRRWTHNTCLLRTVPWRAVRSHLGFDVDIVHWRLFSGLRLCPWLHQLHRLPVPSWVVQWAWGCDMLAVPSRTLWVHFRDEIVALYSAVPARVLLSCRVLE